MERLMFAQPTPLPLAAVTPASSSAGMTTLVLPAASQLPSPSFVLPSQPAALPLSIQPSALPLSATVASTSSSLVHRPIPIAATPRASLLAVASPYVSIPSTHSAFSTAPANSAFSPAMQSQHSPHQHFILSESPSAHSASSLLSPLSSSLPSTSEPPPAYSRPSSTDTASPSLSHKSIASTASPLSATRHHRQSSLSSNTSASPSHLQQHRGSLSSDGGSSSDLLGMTRLESLKSSSEAVEREAAQQQQQQHQQQDVSPVDEDEEDRPTDDSADDDDASPAAAPLSGDAKDEDAPLPQMTVGLSPAQLAAVHKGTSCHQCKNTKQLKKLAFCANLFNKRTKPEKRVCRKKYCETVSRTPHIPSTFQQFGAQSCLKKFYNDNLSDIAGKSWICASCRGVCCCAACTRVGSKKSAKLEAAAVGSSHSHAHSHSPPISSSVTPTGSGHTTPSFDKRTLQQAAQMDAMPLSALPVTAATVPAMLSPNGAPLSFAAAANSLALRQQQAAMQADMINNAHLLATLTPAQQQQIQQQQMLLYNQLQQQQLQQQILLNNIQQQQQLVAALQIQQQQHQQQHPQMSATVNAALLPLAPLTAPLPNGLPQMPLPLTAPIEQDLSTSMLRHSLQDQPIMPNTLPLSAHLSPSVSPTTSPLLYTRTTRTNSSSGKSASPSATKRLHMSARDWPYPSSSPVSSSRAISAESSESSSPLNATRKLHSSHGTPQSAFRAGLPAAVAATPGSGAAEDVRMDEGVAGAAASSAFKTAFSSRKDAVFSNLHRLTQQGDGM